MKVGLLGCGNLGRIIVENAEKFGVEIVSLYDKEYSKAVELSKICGKPCKSFEDFVKGDFDFVIEAASAEAVKEYGERILENGKNLVVLSTAALIDEDLLEKLKRKAKEFGKKIYVPSGAIAGLDGLSVLKFFESEVKLVTRKNPKAFGRNLGLIFKGFAKEAVKKFPRNLNVASTISLATGKNVEVEVYAENLESNIHEVLAKWEFGEIYVRVENVPSKNVKSSYLAALSALSLLRNLKEEVVVW